MQWLEQSTSTTIRIGPFLDETDGKTVEDSLTISQADIRLSKNGGDFAQSNDSGGATHDENGWYYLTLDATDTGTLGRLIVAIHESGALPVWREFMVVPSNMYDSLVLGTDYLQVDAVQIEGSDATDQINAACDTALTDYDAVVPADLSTLATASALADVDANVDLILEDTGTTLNGKIDTIDGIVDAILLDTGTDGVVIANNGITAAKIATDAIGADEIASAGANKIADHVIRRSFQNACDSANGDTKSLRSLLGAIAKLVNKISVSGSTLTIYEDDDTTSLGTQTVTTDSGADPITVLDTD